jgi:chaperonin GroEL
MIQKILVSTRKNYSQDLGSAKRVIITKDNTTIIEGLGSQDAIKGRVAQIRMQIENTTLIMTKKNFKNALLNLPAVSQLSVSARN